MQFGPVNEKVALFADGAILLLGALLVLVALLIMYILKFGRLLPAEVGRGDRIWLALALAVVWLCAFFAVYQFTLSPDDRFGASFVVFKFALSPDHLLSLIVLMALIGILFAVLFWAGLYKAGFWRLLAFFVLFVLWAATVLAAHALTVDRLLLSAIGALIAGIVIVLVFHVAAVRPLISPHDNRIAYTMLFVGAMGLLTVLTLWGLWYFRDHIDLDTKAPLGVANFLQMASVVISAASILFTYLMRSEQANRTANQQIYQTLELQSIDLFRFEANHRDLVQQLWFGTVPEELEKESRLEEVEKESRLEEVEVPPDREAELHVLRQYICQMLNLFEMAYRFRLRGIMEPEVFGSWVIWMWELCESEVFCAFWKHPDDLPANYVKGFSAAISDAVDLRLRQEAGLDRLGKKRVARRRKEQFFDDLAKRLSCPEIKEWL